MFRILPNNISGKSSDSDTSSSSSSDREEQHEDDEISTGDEQQESVEMSTEEVESESTSNREFGDIVGENDARSCNSSSSSDDEDSLSGISNESSHNDARFAIVKRIGGEVFFDSLENSARNVLHWDHGEVHYSTIRSGDDCNCLYPVKGVPRDLQGLVTHKKWMEIYQNIRAIRKIALEKRKKLWRIGIKNPFIGYRHKLWFYSGVCLGFDITSGDLDVYNYYIPPLINNCMFILTIPFYIVWALTLSLSGLLRLLPPFIGFIVDVLTLRICIHENHQHEKEWFIRHYRNHPELDSEEIQKAILEEVTALVNSLNSELDGVVFGVYNEQERVVVKRKRGTSTHYLDVIGISIYPEVEAGQIIAAEAVFAC